MSLFFIKKKHFIKFYLIYSYYLYGEKSPFYIRRGSKMNEQQILDWIGQHIVHIILVLSVFIQIAPVKINPWTSLIKWIGKVLTYNINEKLIKMETNLNILSTSVDENQKDRIRWEVLDFSNSCKQGKRHSKDQFQHIITLNDKYKKLLKRTEDKNGVFDAEYAYIQRIYKKLQETNDFN